MDCEKFDQVIIDALYDELDELTFAALKRHTDVCTRCQAAWSGLKATRKVGLLPLVEAPAGLEARILQVARDAQKSVPFPRRIGRAVSWAGSYAMRPQTAMAALLLLMLGSSLLFLRAKPDRTGAPRVSVTERGVPEQATDDGRVQGFAPEPASAPSRMVARREEERPWVAETEGQAGPSDPRTAKADKGLGAFAEAPRAVAGQGGELALNDRAGGAAVEKKSSEAPGAAATAVPFGQPTGASARDGYAAAMDHYSAGRYVEAEKGFNAIAASGDKSAPQAALYAAKSAEAGLGCGSAATKYEQVASRYGGTSAGAEALWGAATCYRAVGSYTKARSMYLALRSVAGYRDRAEAELANLSLLQQSDQSIASRRPAAVPPAAKAAAPAAPAAKPAPARPAANQPSE